LSFVISFFCFASFLFILPLMTVIRVYDNIGELLYKFIFKQKKEITKLKNIQQIGL